MNKKLLRILLVLALLIGGGVFAFRFFRLHTVPEAAWRCLRQPSQMTLYSIHPEEGEHPAGAQFFHGYRILGQVTVSAPADQQRIADAIHKAVLYIPSRDACFNPRHAIRVSNGQEVCDLVICFECHGMEIFIGDKPAGVTSIGGPPDVLDSILRAASIL